MINRRQFVNRMSLATAAAVALTKSVYSSWYQNSYEYVNVEISHGKIRGVRTEGVNIFRSIPYSGRISGDRRFRRPAPLEAWAGVRDALRLGNPAMQAPNQTYGINEPLPAEDCLFLNIWTPANDNGKRPVMFYNHGGGFSTGSGGSVGQDGANLARFFDVVVVETNHFARTGKPAAKGAPDWPAYNMKDRPTMRIDTKCTVIDKRYAEELKMWSEIGRL